MRGLADRVAIVTGAGQGIGFATAERLAAEGAAVVVNDIDANTARDAAATIVRGGGRCVPMAADATSADAAAALVLHAVETFGSLEIVVNVAGATNDSMFHRLDEQALDRSLDANLKTAFHMTLAAMPQLRDTAKSEIAQSGAPRLQRKIVVTASASALVGNPGQYNYVAAKGALIATTRTLARELAPFGINVNAVAPGLIDTRMTQARTEPGGPGIPEAIRQRMIDEIPMARLGDPADVASAIAFLVSSDADYITGVTLPVTGGILGTM